MSESDWKLPWLGGCRCDRVRFRVTMGPLLSFACHCTGCQRMTAGPYSLTLVVPAASLELTAGEPELGGLHGPNRHFFCAYCKTWLFTRPQGDDTTVNVRASALDEHRWVVPFAEVYTDEAYPWALTGARHSFAGNPTDVPLGPLLEEFQRVSSRP